MTRDSIQNHYPPDLSYCYGCGRMNSQGHQIKSIWDGETSLCTFTPEPYHIAVPGYVYGGLIASLIDCHGTGTAAAAAYREAGRAMDSDPPFRYVTASLHVNYRLPTSLGPPLELKATVEEIKGRKTVVFVRLYAEGRLTADGEVIAVQMPDHMLPKGPFHGVLII